MSVSDCCLTQHYQFFTFFPARKNSTRWDDADVSYVLDQHAKLDFYSKRSLKMTGSSRLDTSLHLETLCQFWVNHSLLWLLNDTSSQRSSKHQFYSHWFDKTEEWDHSLTHLRWANHYITDAVIMYFTMGSMKYVAKIYF